MGRKKQATIDDDDQYSFPQVDTPPENPAVTPPDVDGASIPVIFSGKKKSKSKKSASGFSVLDEDENGPDPNLDYSKVGIAPESSKRDDCSKKSPQQKKKTVEEPDGEADVDESKEETNRQPLPPALEKDEVAEVGESAAAKKKKKKKEKKAAAAAAAAEVKEEKKETKGKAPEKKPPKHVREMQEMLAKRKEA